MPDLRHSSGHHYYCSARRQGRRAHRGPATPAVAP
jgi:hypothetical protein